MALRNIADLIGLKDSRQTQLTQQNKSSRTLAPPTATVAVKTTQTVGSSATTSSRLLQVVSQYVPNEVQTQLCFVRLEDRQLRLTVSNAAAATRLRFAGQQIRQGLTRTLGLAVDRVSVHVKPQEGVIFKPQRPAVRSEPVSESTIRLIESAANSVEKNAQRDRNNNADGEFPTATSGSAEDQVEKDPLATALKRLAAALANRQ